MGQQAANPTPSGSQSQMPMGVLGAQGLWNQVNNPTANPPDQDTPPTQNLPTANPAVSTHNQTSQAMSGQGPSAADIVRTTQYGWAKDPDMDSNTAAGLGLANNQLTPHAAALSDAEAQSLGAKRGDALQVGNQLYYYADRAPENDKRVDLYQPQGMNPNIPDFQAIKDLGGGSNKLSGQTLAQVGEQNVQKYGSPFAPISQASEEPAQLPNTVDYSKPEPVQAPKNQIMVGSNSFNSARASDNGASLNNGMQFLSLLQKLNPRNNARG